jgi:hypothetical protein
MKTLMSLAVCVFVCSLSEAQSQGPLSGTVFSNISIPGSNQSWTNIGNAGSSDDAYASFSDLAASGDYTDYLQATGFGFSLPSSAVIKGIAVEIERSDPNSKTADYALRIVKGGVISSYDHTPRSLSSYSTSDSYQSFGDATDLWGESWTVADINSANFGFAIAAKRSSAGGTTGGQIDHIRITVFYTNSFATLPLHLIDFSATKTDNRIKLGWSTAQETDMEYFELQRSVSGNDFTAIGTIACSNGSQNNYSFYDEHPAKGIAYYRLKMIGAAGYEKYSKVVTVQFSNGSAISFYPVPLQKGQGLHITNPNKEKLIVEFYNPAGQLVDRSTTASDLVSANAAISGKGLFFVKVFGDNKQLLAAGKLIVE